MATFIKLREMITNSEGADLGEVTLYLNVDVIATIDAHGMPGQLEAVYKDGTPHLFVNESAVRLLSLVQSLSGPENE